MLNVQELAAVEGVNEHASLARRGARREQKVPWEADAIELDADTSAHSRQSAQRTPQQDRHGRTRPLRPTHIAPTEARTWGTTPSP